MTVSNERLELLFNDFSKFISIEDEKPFISFKTSAWIDKTENYKYAVYNEARENLGNKRWKTKDIGSGVIQKSVSSAIQTKVIHDYRQVENNLIDWRKKDNFNKISQNSKLEELFFNFYKSKIPDQQAFENLIEEKFSYQLIAYLFFIKDFNKYMPITQEKFDEIFEQIGLMGFKTSYNLSWENYSIYNYVIRQVRDFLKKRDVNATLLDAHSFLWILDQMKYMGFSFTNHLPPSTIRDIVEIELIKTVPIEIIVEENDELGFPEGKDKYLLHISKERNQELIKIAKEKRFKENKKLCCEVCEFSFVDKYGEIGEGFIEAHHLFPISELREETLTKIEDIALVCSNCHRMLHRRRPWLTLENLKILIL